MSNQVIRQPDDRYAIYSSISGRLLVRDATAEQIIRWFIQRAVDDAKLATAKVLYAVNSRIPQTIYHQFVLTWSEAVALDRASREHENTAQP